jgi:hypothetical protein
MDIKYESHNTDIDIFLTNTNYKLLNKFLIDNNIGRLPCQGSGWTDLVPVSNKQFNCSEDGNYIPVNKQCPPELEYVNNTCMPSKVPLKCSGFGWTDPNPNSNGIHYDCDDYGNYIPNNKNCPPGLQYVNNTCMPPEVPSKCTGLGWTDPNPSSNGRHFNCDNNGNYIESAGGYCPGSLANINGICKNNNTNNTDTSNINDSNKFNYDRPLYNVFINSSNMGEYILENWNKKRYPLPNYKRVIYNKNYKTLDDIVNFYKNNEINNDLRDNIYQNLLFKHHSNINLCNYMKKFYKYNSFIICYISEFQEVKTLNYEFFGSYKSESYLTLRKDKFHSYLNSKNGLLTYYKNNILNCKENIIEQINFTELQQNFSLTKIIDIFIKDVFPYLYCLYNEYINTEEYNNNILNALSFTNTIEYKNELGDNNNIQDIINMCSVETIHLHKTRNNKSSDIEESISPMIWKINSNSNVDDSCNFTLSSSKLEDTVTKYPQFNLDGTTNLSLFNSGENQVLHLENQRLIYESSNKDTNNIPLYSAITGNLRSTNGLYLVDSADNVGFTDDVSSIKLQSKPYLNGKWFILGFNLQNKNQLNKIFNYKLF